MYSIPKLCTWGHTEPALFGVVLIHPLCNFNGPPEDNRLKCCPRNMTELLMLRRGQHARWLGKQVWGRTPESLRHWMAGTRALQRPGGHGFAHLAMKATLEGLFHLSPVFQPPKRMLVLQVWQEPAVDWKEYKGYERGEVLFSEKHRLNTGLYFHDPSFSITHIYHLETFRRNIRKVEQKVGNRVFSHKKN